MGKQSVKKQLVGVVVSDKMDKTVVVKVQRLTKHPRYKKYIRRCSKFSIHDVNNVCHVGDMVLITESKPISRTKRWRLSSVLKKAI